MKMTVEITEREVDGFEVDIKSPTHFCVGSFCRICEESRGDAKEAIIKASNLAGINRTREQSLVDLCFHVGLMLSTPGKDRGDEKYDMTKWTDAKKADWIAYQLKMFGFDTEPVGSSWGVLK